MKEKQLTTRFIAPPDRRRLWGGLMVMIMLFLTTSAFAQKAISGKITDESGNGLPGVTIAVKGTSTGTTSDIDGNYKLSVPPGSTLQISYTGYDTKLVEVGDASTFDLSLQPNETLIAELVVTGYTVDTRKQTTGSVSTVKTRDLTAVPSGNVEQQLQGRVAGVTVITNGQPGTSSIVRVRGFNAFGGNEPLYIVDGLPTYNVDFLSPDDIESTTVLKDAAAASIYGARAASGVIVFTTKRGTKKAQPLTISYDGSVGFTTPGTAQEILNPQEQADWTWNALRNTGQATTHPQYGSGGTPVLPDYINVGGAAGVIGTVDLAAEKAKYNIDPTVGSVYQVVKANKAGTDWYGEITDNAPMTRHSLGFTGSTDRARYYVGTNLQYTQGILRNNSFQRNTFRVNTEFDLGKRVRVGENLQLLYRKVLGQTGGNNGAGIPGDENAILSAFRMPSIIPVYDEFGGYAGTAAKGFNNPRNPVAERDGIADNRGFGFGVLGNFYLEVDPIKNLTLRSSIGGFGSSSSYKNYNRLQYENSENNASFSYGEGGSYGFSWTFTNTAIYKAQFGESSLDLLGGIEAVNGGDGRVTDASGLSPFSTDPNYINLNTVSNRQVGSFYFKGNRFFSVFGRVNYGFRDKYYITGVVRRDGSSVFGESNRFGVFPAISAAWRVTGESFMDGVTFLDDLKIRGGWGQMGNSNISGVNQFSLFGGNVNDSYYDINGSNTGTVEGFYQSRIGNPDAKWETSETTNIGFDALLGNGKWDVILDLWRKKTKDLLYTVPLPQVIGSSAASPAVNIASMLNEGIDLQIVNKGRFGANSRYELTLTGSWLNNEITGLAPGIDYFDSSPGTNRLSSPPIRNQVGYSISAFYGYEVLGLFANQAEVDGAPTQDGAGPGRFRFADLNGMDDQGELTGRPDGKIDAADRTYLGSPVPKFMGGVNFKVVLGNFDVETYIYTALGGKIYNLSKWYTDFYPSFTGAAISSRVKDSWTPSNLGAELPIFENVSNFSTNTQSNSFYVEDGSYARMQNLAIGYTVPTSALSKLKVKRLRLYVSTNNVFTISKYKGLDPAVGGAVDTTFGIDIGNYPVTRSFMFGVSAGL
ncbi:MAG TPA: SusC/RagA family TonB-linked outer membrane protein [Saprospiraceae bacterium]|nr:SusC/RagA family TonB-linked outer membrane protein [Saprospiraceae bacterium]